MIRLTSRGIRNEAWTFVSVLSLTGRRNPWHPLDDQRGIKIWGFVSGCSRKQMKRRSFGAKVLSLLAVPTNEENYLCSLLRITELPPNTYIYISSMEQLH